MKWNNQDMTKAKTIQPSKKLRNRWPCQKLRVSEEGTDVEAVAASFASFHCSSNSTSFGPATLRAIDPHISQVLQFKGILGRSVHTDKTKNTHLNQINVSAETIIMKNADSDFYSVLQYNFNLQVLRTITVIWFSEKPKVSVKNTRSEV